MFKIELKKILNIKLIAEINTGFCLILEENKISEDLKKYLMKILKVIK